jgi:hypothetical protein
LGVRGTATAVNTRAKPKCGESEGTTPLERLRSKWDDNIKINLRFLVCWDVDWGQLAQYRDL